MDGAALQFLIYLLQYTALHDNNFLFNIIFQPHSKFRIPCFSDTTDRSVTTAAHDAQNTVKLKRKEYYDRRNHVLIKKDKRNIPTVNFEYRRYVVTAKKGTMITTESPINQSIKTGSFSHFKKIPQDTSFPYSKINEGDDELIK